MIKNVLIIALLITELFIGALSLFALIYTGNQTYLLPLLIAAAGAFYAIPACSLRTTCSPPLPVHTTHYHILYVAEPTPPPQENININRRW
ncbi:hypothetical protein ASZ90_017202 [hydrocarbon metagenome]|uniref:Uncharacterized protein n=1 Tax=hydrocarbon metagenome TaxID=938273 RepID=A0A0W8E9N6_9ZZZZ